MIVDASSLIFVVIVGIWAAYLLGHWVRRRDQVATARSVDRFSDAMKVLERRPAVRSVPLSRPNPRSYVVAPAHRPSSQVTVKRAPAVVAPPAAASAVAPAAARRPAGSARGRQLRGLTLLGLLVATPVVWVLVALTAATPWWAGALVTLALAGTIGSLRHSTRRARELARRRELTQRRSVTQQRRQSRRAVVGQVVAAHRERGGADVPVPSQPAVEAPADPVATEPMDGGWQPVPVPPPTYTLKPKASPPRRRVAAPLPATPMADEPAPAAAPASVPAEPLTAAAGGFDLDEILERRIASGG